MDNDAEFGYDKAVDDRKSPLAEYFEHVSLKVAIPTIRERIYNIGDQINEQKGQKGEYQPSFIFTN